MTPEIDEDPFYASALTILGSLAAIRDAGYFSEGRERIAPAGPEWMSVPVEKLRRRLADLSRDPTRPIAVLLTTGAFNPLHVGHVELMAAARAELELQGWFVAGGYFSPSHDAYVAGKLGDQALDAVARLELCQLVCAASDWLMAADWESLGVDRAVNFTTVLAWLAAYLARHLATAAPLEIFYVFGSDNARFVRSFVGHGRCVCVVRPGFDAAVARYAADPHVRGNPRILFARHASVLASSSSIRTGRTDLMEPRSRARYLHAVTRRDRPSTARRATYVLRDECGWEVAPWLPGRDEAQLQRARRWFHDQLTCLLRQAHARTGTSVDFHWLDLDAQRAGLAALAPARTLSIDAPIAGHADLAVSRRFALSGAHIEPELSHRPGSPPLADQLQHIPPGHYVLLDDDVCTGATLAGIRALLPPGIVLDREHILFRKPAEDPPLDVLDCRDFLAGAREGGLVVTCPDGSLARAPYCLPYVSACERASVPLAEELAFSRDLWRLNAGFFASIDPPIRLADADPSFRRLMHHVGLADTMTMADVCDWHAERCARTIARASP